MPTKRVTKAEMVNAMKNSKVGCPSIMVETPCRHPHTDCQVCLQEVRAAIIRLIKGKERRKK